MRLRGGAWKRVLAPALALVALAAASPARAAEPQTYALKAGEAVFWPAGASACADAAAPCWEYRIEVREQAWRLRVGIDRRSIVGSLSVQVYSPGSNAADSFGPDVGLYSDETVAPAPRRGTWRIRVTASEVDDVRFRMRAKLEKRPVAEPAKTPVPPNIQASPPYVFSFYLPVTNGNMDPPIGLALPGGRASCHPEEVLLEHALRCLRMAFGVRNTGQGPMDLRFVDAGPPFPDQPLTQRVRNADGSSVARPAGTATYHLTHQHYHQKDAVALTLFAVADPKRGGLTPAGAEHRKGFHHRNELLREWNRFYPTWSQDADDGTIALAAGWADYYEWDRPGNYVDFGLNAGGYYVVRMVADPGNGILESNEQDNNGYSFIRVAGDAVTLLESGRGTDPWDRCKIVVPFGSDPEPPAGDRPPRPANCPPDTVWPPEPPAVAKKKRKKAKPKCKRRSKDGKRKCRARRAAI